MGIGETANQNSLEEEDIVPTVHNGGAVASPGEALPPPESQFTSEPIETDEMNPGALIDHPMSALITEPVGDEHGVSTEVERSTIAPFIGQQI
jgi:hypothetical protein